MNRREFFSATSAITCAAGATALATGLLSANPMFDGVVSPQLDTRPDHFRAKKVFLDSWATETMLWKSFHNASFVQSRLNAICHDGCNGLILVPGHCSNDKWIKRIETEANRMELTVLVPVQLTRNFLRLAQTVVPLAHEEGIIQCCDEKALQVAMLPMANDGGFLLLNATDNVFGLVLYDASRCLLTGFASSAAGLAQKTECCNQDSKLAAARWIDHARQSFS